jgi:hypothetical protein
MYGTPGAVWNPLPRQQGHSGLWSGFPLVSVRNGAGGAAALVNVRARYTRPVVRSAGGTTEVKPLHPPSVRTLPPSALVNALCVSHPVSIVLPRTDRSTYNRITRILGTDAACCAMRPV